MKIALSTDNDFISAHFGRCPTYTIIEVNDDKIIHREEIANPGHQPGFLPQFLSGKGVNIVIAGGMGPRAQGLFAQYNIETIIGIQGSIDDIIQKFLKSELESGEDQCSHQHGQGHTCGEEHSQAPQIDQMKSLICVTSLGNTMDSQVDPKFGRAHFFLFIDPGKEEIEAITNPNQDAAHGAGIQSAQLVAEKGTGILFTGECGPNAEKVLSASGVKIVTGVQGTVRDVLAEFLKGSN